MDRAIFHWRPEWVGLISLGLLCLMVGVRYYVLARRSMWWPSCRGRMISFSLEEARNGGQSGTVIYPRVKYTYLVNGTVHVSERVAYDMAVSASSGSRESLNSPYPRVYFDPARPGRSVLRPGYGVNNFVVIVIGVVLVGGGLLAALTR